MVSTIWTLLNTYKGLAIAPGKFPIAGEIPKDLFRKGVHYGLIQKIEGQWLLIKPMED